MREPVDLTAHINATVERGNPADFPVTLKPVFVQKNGALEAVPRRLAVVRNDTNAPLGIVSDRYSLVPHQQILDLVDQATAQLDVGTVPRGVFVDRGGARMRALFKFPTLARPVANGDDICPFVKVQNTYDGTSRIAVHIGAFRFVCTNLAVGGGGTFAGGFMAVHAGEIPIAKVAEELGSYLARFEAIVELYRAWSAQPLGNEEFHAILEDWPKRAAEAIRRRVSNTNGLRPSTRAITRAPGTRHITCGVPRPRSISWNESTVRSRCASVPTRRRKHKSQGTRLGFFSICT
jgi:hypothetical protein